MMMTDFKKFMLSYLLGFEIIIVHRQYLEN
jgi:hypothetical protein